MAFNPAIRTERTVLGEDRTWLDTMSGWDTARSVTLDISTFTEAESVDGRVIHSGIALGKVTSGGLYAPYDPDASDGTEVATGFLFTSVQIDDADVALASNVGAAMIWEGIVIEANFFDFGSAEGMIDAALKVDLPTFRFE